MTGLETDWVEDGAAAVEKLKEVADGYYDIVFMDIQMPNMNGYEAAAAIRAIDRDYTKNVPIIAMTANAFEDDIKMAKQSGMNEHIAKPIDFGELGRVFGRWLE